MISLRGGRASGAAGRTAAAALAVLAAALVLLSAPDVRAEDPAPTNLDLMTKLGSQVIEDIFAKFNSDVKGVRVQLYPEGNTEEYEFLEDVFTQLLEERGVETVHGVRPDGDSLYTIDYKIPVFRLSYPKVYRSYLIGGKKVKREANLRMRARLVSANGDVLWIGESSAKYSDQFSHGDLTRVQEGSYEFVKPEMPSSGWGKVVEPVLVSAIIVGMVYLFFSNQSDS